MRTLGVRRLDVLAQAGVVQALLRLRARVGSLDHGGDISDECKCKCIHRHRQQGSHGPPASS